VAEEQRRARIVRLPSRAIARGDCAASVRRRPTPAPRRIGRQQPPDTMRPGSSAEARIVRRGPKSRAPKGVVFRAAALAAKRPHKFFLRADCQLLSRAAPISQKTAETFGSANAPTIQRSLSRFCHAGSRAKGFSSARDSTRRALRSSSETPRALPHRRIAAPAAAGHDAGEEQRRGAHRGAQGAGAQARPVCLGPVASERRAASARSYSSLGAPRRGAIRR
jgi:hypothetical protein